MRQVYGLCMNAAKGRCKAALPCTGLFMGSGFFADTEQSAQNTAQIPGTANDHNLHLYPAFPLRSTPL